MEELIQQERFEIEVLEKLNSKRFLDSLVFTGGSMLRLCYGLDRYSVDLDFWLAKKIDNKKLYADLKSFLGTIYKIIDAANKYYSILINIKSNNYPRNLKIEIRKEIKDVKIDRAIAFSKYANSQILLNTVSLDDMMEAKIKAFINRKEIRDCFDIEFLLKKGVEMKINKKTAEKVAKGLNLLTKNDYRVKLYSVINPEMRNYYSENNFRILKMALAELPE
jgi:predicted nucleotidyltransferase component of viral defense system